MSIVLPVPLAVMSAFCTTSRCAFRLLWPALLLTKAASLMSLLAPMACTSRLPAALIAPPVARLSSEPAAVINTRAPALDRLLCASPSFVTVSVAPSEPTMFTLILSNVPTCKPLACVRYSPNPPKLLAASWLTSSSRWFVLSPTPCVAPVPVATMRNWLALTSTSVVPLSLML